MRNLSFLAHYSIAKAIQYILLHISLLFTSTVSTYSNATGLGVLFGTALTYWMADSQVAKQHKFRTLLEKLSVTRRPET
jgi:hypothetical protein